MPTSASEAQERAAQHTCVEIELLNPAGENEHLLFNLVPDDQADFYAGFLGESTPLGRALLGRQVGEVVSYRVGSEVQRVRLLAVRPMTTPAVQAAAERKAAVQQAVEQVQRTNALIFATTVEGKWGDYDADGLAANWD